MTRPGSKLIVALDVDSPDRALEMAVTLRGVADFFKVGSELFTTAGPDVVTALKQKGCSVFLDLKFHDIPNTVAGAVKAACGLRVDMLNVHAAGGVAMMEAAADAAHGFEPRPILLAVTVLTSISEEVLNDEIGIERDVDTAVTHFAGLAKQSGLDGVVASPRECSLIRAELGKDFVIVAPGVRPAWASKNDQSRVATPAQAIADGADYVVVGRPITRAADPAGAARRIVDELESATGTEPSEEP